jgi:UDP-N-acetyl-D-galactosamine dehydrogenase
MNLAKVKIAMIGQGYVGLPLAIEFGKKYPTLGFDINQARIDELKKDSNSVVYDLKGFLPGNLVDSRL